MCGDLLFGTEMESANLAIADWWEKKKTKVEELIDKLEKIQKRAPKDPKKAAIEWNNTYLDLLRELVDLPIEPQHNLFCREYLKNNRCRECPYGAVKGICYFKGSLRDYLFRRLLKVRDVLKYMQLSDLPDELDLGPE